MVDDDDLKIRRNLVTFSAVVIAAWWLEAKVSAPTLLFFTVTTTENSERVWALCLAVLAYLALRYKDAKLEEGLVYRQLVNRELERLTIVVTFEYLKLHLWLYNTTGLKTKFIASSLDAYIQKQWPGAGGSRGERIKVIPTVRHRDALGQIVEPSGIRIVGEWPFGTTLYTGTPQDVKSSTSGGYEWILPITRGFHALIIWAYSRSWWFFYAKPAVLARFPVILGFVATSIAIWKIGAFYVAPLESTSR